MHVKFLHKKNWNIPNNLNYYTTQTNLKFESNKYYFNIRPELKIQLLSQFIVVPNEVSMQAALLGNAVSQNF